MGSLVAAVASFVDARACGGEWLVRMEDVDAPRCVPGAADLILRTLVVYGLEWDGDVLYQSARLQAYAEALRSLVARGAAYPCACSRREVGDVYPRTCRDGLPPQRVGRCWRVAAPLDSDLDDFVLKRADGLFAYQLAVVVDDGFQGITHVVRGADLLDSMPRQIYLQTLLGLPHPEYRHVPIVTDARGQKLSKQTLAPPLDLGRPAPALIEALRFLGFTPSQDLNGAAPAEILTWAVDQKR